MEQSLSQRGNRKRARTGPSKGIVVTPNLGPAVLHMTKATERVHITRSGKETSCPAWPTATFTDRGSPRLGLTTTAERRLPEGESGREGGWMLPGGGGENGTVIDSQRGEGKKERKRERGGMIRGTRIDGLKRQGAMRLALCSFVPPAAEDTLCRRRSRSAGGKEMK